MPKKDGKVFIIVMTTGERYETRHESKERLMRWLNTGVAGFLPLRGREMVRFTPENVKEIIEEVEENERENI